MIPDKISENMHKNNLHAVILAGGSGTRFWPLSRHRRPKQLIPLLGGKTTLEATIERLSPLTDDSRIMVITNKDQVRAVEKLLASRFSQARIIAEPVGRNTAPAIALAAQLLAMDQGPETTMMVFPADHYIGDLPEFIRTLELAADAAKRGWLVTLGIAPSRPETGYGYIQGGDEIAMGGEGAIVGTVRAVSRFVEKPDAKRAVEYLLSGDYFWNSGIFIWRTDVILAEIARHLPAVDACLQRFSRECQELGFEEALAAYFQKVEAISIDYGVLEKSSRVVVVPGCFSWSDLGSWDALDELNLQLQTEFGEENSAATMLFSAENNTVFSSKATALIEVDNLLVVDTEDALLICKKGSSQRVKEVVEHLRQQGKNSLL